MGGEVALDRRMQGMSQDIMARDRDLLTVRTGAEHFCGAARDAEVCEQVDTETSPEALARLSGIVKDMPQFTSASMISAAGFDDKADQFTREKVLRPGESMSLADFTQATSKLPSGFQARAILAFMYGTGPANQLISASRSAIEDANKLIAENPSKTKYPGFSAASEGTSAKLQINEIQSEALARATTAQARIVDPYRELSSARSAVAATALMLNGYAYGTVVPTDPKISAVLPFHENRPFAEILVDSKPKEMPNVVSVTGPVENRGDASSVLQSSELGSSTVTILESPPPASTATGTNFDELPTQTSTASPDANQVTATNSTFQFRDRSDARRFVEKFYTSKGDDPSTRRDKEYTSADFADKMLDAEIIAGKPEMGHGRQRQLMPVKKEVFSREAWLEKHVPEYLRAEVREAAQILSSRKVAVNQTSIERVMSYFESRGVKPAEMKEKLSVANDAVDKNFIVDDTSRDTASFRHPSKGYQANYTSERGAGKFKNSRTLECDPGGSRIKVKHEKGFDVSRN